jgi:hypothetical protein
MNYPADAVLQYLDIEFNNKPTFHPETQLMNAQQPRPVPSAQQKGQEPILDISYLYNIM